MKTGTKAEDLKATGKLKEGYPANYGKGRTNPNNILGGYPKSQNGKK